jgi:hypothetical protein
MTKRSTQFPAVATVPTIIKQTQKQSESAPSNPLTAFFRKSKLSLTLPSRGKWYPANSIAYDDSGQLSVFAMNASDDIKFRTGDATMSGKNIYEVITSCIPSITQPEMIPHIDIDAILLAIRVASYGPIFDFVVSVPNTTLTRSITINSNDLLKDISSRQDQWDSEINIEDETGQLLSLVVAPIPLKILFSTSKNIYMLRRLLTKNVDQDENIKDETTFTTNMNSLSLSAIDLLCASIQTLSVSDAHENQLIVLNSENPQDREQIRKTIHQIDVAYFNSIRDHIDAQRIKYTFMSPEQKSTEKEVAAGAPETWATELTFMGSNFLPEPKA